jgi:predicted DCC family thiol-disulfide oxidoreductase YuxK
MASATVSTAAKTQPALLLYDGLCPLCQKSIKVLRRLDWLGKLAYQNARDVERVPSMDPPLQLERMLEEMHLVTPDGQSVYVGFYAFRWLAWRLPLLIPLAPLLYLPGMPWLGGKVYRWVARNRFNLVPCNDGQCQVPAARGDRNRG